MMVSAVAATPHDDEDSGGGAAALPLLALLAPLALSLEKRCKFGVKWTLFLFIFL